MVILIAPQQCLSVRNAKVFEVQQRLRKILPNKLHKSRKSELVDEGSRANT